MLQLAAGSSMAASSGRSSPSTRRRKSGRGSPTTKQPRVCDASDTMWEDELRQLCTNSSLGAWMELAQDRAVRASHGTAFAAAGIGGGGQRSRKGGEKGQETDDSQCISPAKAVAPTLYSQLQLVRQDRKTATYLVYDGIVAVSTRLSYL